MLKRALFLRRGPDGVVTSKTRLLHWTINILALVIWACAFTAACLYFARPGYGRELFFSYFSNARILLLNILPVLLITFFIYLLSNRVWIATLTSGVLLFAVTLINYFKLLSRSDPLLASDARYIVEAAKIGEGYDFSFTGPIIAVIIGILLVSALSFFLFRARLPNRRRRGVMLAVLIVLGAALYAGVYRSDDVYEKTANLNVAMSNGKVMSQWSDTDNYVCRGFFYPLVHSTAKLGDGRPEGYDKNEASDILVSYARDDIPEGEKVSVIAVMLEAYNDFSEFGLTFENDPYEFFHELRAQGISGRLVTNIFAGDTIDTERSFITGSTVKYEYRKGADSFARYFKDQGYYTEFTHPCYGWFYNRQNVFEYLGFDARWFYETRYQMPEGWGMMHDGPFFADLVALFDECTEKRAQPYFNFSVTYQNHGPYPADYRESDVNYYSADSLSAAGANILNNYLAGIKETDDALRSFVGGLSGRDEPVVLILFGDHNPWLGGGGWVYGELGVSLELGSEEGFYNYYCTPYVIWANDAAKEALNADFIGEGGDISPAFLLSLLFDEAGWGGDGFMKMNRELRGASDVFHKTGVILQDGVLTGDVPEDVRALYDRYQAVQYYRMRDF